MNKLIVFIAALTISPLLLAQPTAFKAGEKLTFLAHYGWLDGAEAEMTVNKVQLDSTEVMHAKIEARSVGLTDMLYRMHDIYESYFNEKTLLPVKSIRNISENKYRKYNEVTYDREIGLVHSKLKGTQEMPKDIHDIVSAFYLGRDSLFINPAQDQVVQVNTYFEDELFPLKIRYVGLKTINTRFGKIECLTFNPLVMTGRLFDNEEDLTIYITNDENRIPIRLQMDIFLGSVKVDLIRYSGLAHPLVFTN